MDYLTDGSILSSQWRSEHETYVSRLERAVLIEAVKCFYGTSTCNAPQNKWTKRKLQRAAEWWIFSADHDGPFTFLKICDCMHVDFKTVRTVVKAGLDPSDLLKHFRRSKRTVHSAIAMAEHLVVVGSAH